MNSEDTIAAMLKTEADHALARFAQTSDLADLRQAMRLTCEWANVLADAVYDSHREHLTAVAVARSRAASVSVDYYNAERLAWSNLLVMLARDDDLDAAAIVALLDENSERDERDAGVG